jgi:hypothetical protein
VVGVVNVKFIAVCNGAGFKPEAVVAGELERKLNAGFDTVTALLEIFRPPPNPVLSGLLTDKPLAGLLTDKPVPVDD